MSIIQQTVHKLEIVPNSEQEPTIYDFIELLAIMNEWGDQVHKQLINNLIEKMMDIVHCGFMVQGGDKELKTNHLYLAKMIVLELTGEAYQELIECLADDD